MGRGRKRKGESIVLSNEQIFQKNAGSYFQNILVELGKMKPISKENSLELLSLIKKEKDRIGKREKEIQPIKNEEIPFLIPKNWVWCRFQEVTSLITCGIASTPKYYPKGKIFLSAKNVKPFRFLPNDFKYVDEETYRKVTQSAKPEIGDVLITRVGAGIGQTAVIDQDIDFAFYVSLTLVKPIKIGINSDFIAHWLNSDFGIQNAIDHTSGDGSNQGNLNVNRVRTFLIPLPPLLEQINIIRFLNDFKNNELKPYGSYFNIEIEKKIVKLHNSYLNGSELIHENNYQLAQLENLNQAILQEAVQGKLVKQNKKDEPASELLKRIKAEKAKSGKKENPLPPIKPEEIPFEIPDNWACCRLGDAIEFNYGKGLTKDQCIPNSKYPVFGSNGIVGYFNKYLTDKRTIVAGRKGSAGALNICSIPSWTTDVAYYIEENQHLNFEFVYFLLKSLQLEKFGKGIKPGLNRNEAYLIPILLPPLSEQKCIVSEIEKQLAKTKQLKEHIIANQQATEQLLKALLHQAFEVEEK